MLACRVASHCGIPDIDLLRDSLETEQMEKWEAYDQREGLGLRRVVRLLAEIVSAIYCTHGVEKTPEDYMPWLEHIPEIQSDQEQQARIRVAVAAHNS